MLILFRLAAGFLCGIIATLPMSAVMVLLFRRLPARERYALPPAEIVLVAEATAEMPITPMRHMALTLAAHFGYGGALGAVFAVLPQRWLSTPALRGPVWGVFVWLANYLGLLPALRILKPATEHPMRRNALMIVAHLVWGCALAASLRAMRIK